MSATVLNQTVLKERYFVPFDRAYEDVTREMRDVAATLTGTDRAWLNRLIETFALERHRWNERPELERYRRRWGRLRLRFLWLVAGVYLHISYDLPRAIADDWPGQANWTNEPSQLRGKQIYSGVKGVFSRTLRRVSRDIQIMGRPFIIFGVLPIGWLAPSGNWMLQLRRAAWDHAEVLATQPDRSRREEAMARAMCAALEDVSDFRPWKGLVLEPPDEVLFSYSALSLAALLTGTDPMWLGIGVAIGMSLLSLLISNFRFRRLEQSMESNSFAEEFAQRVYAYVSFAVRDPEGLEIYLADIRSAAGFAPEQDGGAAPAG